MPIMVPAPGRLSMMNCCPRPSVSFGAMMRATMSVPPPAEDGTTIRTGLPGYPCARLPPAAMASTAVHTRRRVIPDFMLILLLGFLRTYVTQCEISLADCKAWIDNRASLTLTRPVVYGGTGEGNGLRKWLMPFPI